MAEQGWNVFHNKEPVSACQGVQKREMSKRYIHLKLKTKVQVANFNFWNDVKLGPPNDNEMLYPLSSTNTLKKIIFSNS